MGSHEDVVISDPQHRDCSNLTETRRASYMCHHKNNVPSQLSPQWLCGNSYTWASYMVGQKKKVPKIRSSITKIKAKILTKSFLHIIL